jgi:hypothetical protein
MIAQRTLIVTATTDIEVQLRQILAVLLSG